MSNPLSNAFIGVQIKDFDILIFEGRKGKIIIRVCNNFIDLIVDLFFSGNRLIKVITHPLSKFT